MIYNCVLPADLTAEEKAAVGNANISFDQRTPIVGDVLSIVGIRFKVSGITFNIVNYPPNSTGEGGGSCYHETTLLSLTKFPV